jgi:integration host factor subunit alpha
MACKVQKTPTITKISLVESVREIVDLGVKQNKALVDYIFEFIESELTVGRRFPIVDAGRIAVRVKDSRPGRNPKTGEDIKITSRLSIKMGKSKVKSNDSSSVDGRLSTRHEFREALRSKFSITGQQATDIHFMFSDTIARIPETLGRMEIRGFGSFFAKEVGRRTGRNPKTGEEVSVAETVKSEFKASKEMRIRIQNSGHYGVFPSE